MPAATGDHVDRAFCRLYGRLKARAEAAGLDLDRDADLNGADDRREGGS